MLRTSDEALYDSVVRPIIPYTAPTSWNLLESREQAREVEEQKRCAKCLSPIKPFSESFHMGAGQGCVFLVNEKSGLCRSCFDALRANPPTYKPAPRTKINYAFGSEELQTTEDME